MLKVYSAIIFVILLLTLAIVAPAQQQKLEYEVNVRALIIPVFAVDAKGNPVYDLKADEIQLLVDGKPFEIAQLTPFTVAEQTAAPTAAKKTAVLTVTPMGRISFIILDSLANDRRGLKRAREIANGIINKSPEDDAFVILESNPEAGLKYIMGPETDKKKLTRTIKEIKLFAGAGYKTKMRKAIGIDASGARSVELPKEPVSDGSLEGNSRTQEYRRWMYKKNMQKQETMREMYLKAMRRFAYSLVQLKYALKTIVQPKTVYLISGGVPAHHLEHNVLRYYDFLDKSAVAINQGGSLLMVVNSVQPKRAGAGETLKFMAEKSGGKYFAGSDLNKVISRVEKHTTAYYELAFYPGAKSKDNVRINVKSKRKGVSLATVNHAERGKPYSKMKKLQKKLFALSVVTGGSWSRIVGQVNKIKVKKVKGTNVSGNAKTVSVKLPPTLAGHKLDIFTINLDPLTMNSNIHLSTQSAGSENFLRIKIPVELKKDQYLVIVEPEKTLCVYNLIK